MATPETRPDELSNTWAESGTVADLGDVATGWPAGRPGRGRMNKVLNWLMQGVRYLLHKGLPTYSSACTYEAGDTVRAATDGEGYKCILANGPGAAKEPSANPTYWVRWGGTQTADTLSSGDCFVDTDATVAGFVVKNGMFTEVVVIVGSVTYDQLTPTVSLKGAANSALNGRSNFLTTGVGIDGASHSVYLQVKQAAGDADTVNYAFMFSGPGALPGCQLSGTLRILVW